MFDIRAIRDNPDAFRAAWNRKKPGLGDSVDEILAHDEALRSFVTEKQSLEQRRNQASKLIGEAMKEGDTAEAERLKLSVTVAKARLEVLANEEERDRTELESLLYGLPNIPLDEVPEGQDEDGNVEQARWGEPKSFAFEVKDHADLGEALGMMDFETAAKMSGARFVLLKGKLARLERALAAFMLDVQTEEHGYTECSPPFLVKDHAMRGTGQLPKFGEDLFLSGDFRGRGELFAEAIKEFDERWDQQRTQYSGPSELLLKLLDEAPVHEQFWLIPTAEVPLTNIVRDGILEPGELPKRFTAHTPCFRSEAGSAGRDTKGMIRLHQFNKVELVSVVANQEEGLAELERMTRSAEAILKKLDLPFRRMLLCAGDMGAGARKTYDLEVWLPSQDTYREISSCSYCGDYQARRMNARYRPEAGAKPEFVHTLNGSGLAVGRTLVAILENYQNEDGSITVPEALCNYMGGLEVISA